MSIITQPSNRTAREACAPRASSSINSNRRPNRMSHLARLTVIAVALLGMVGMTIPASAQQFPSDSVTGTLVSSLQTTAVAQPAPASAAPVQTGTGQNIVNFAMQYLGSPYVWAGNGPGGFDCSGFTQFVIANTVGIDIGQGVPGQTGYGAWVDWGTWAPGDLVFFANTYAAGLSHVGIYIGDGQFIHAENQSTGVTISSVYSDYYSGHYAGAYRIG